MRAASRTERIRGDQRRSSDGSSSARSGDSGGDAANSAIGTSYRPWHAKVACLLEPQDEPWPRIALLRGSEAGERRFCVDASQALRFNGMSAAQRITVDLPAALAGRSVTELADRARFLLVVDEVRSNRMTRAAGARALGMALDDFLIAAGKCGLYAIDYDIEDFRRELDGLPKARD